MQEQDFRARAKHMIRLNSDQIAHARAKFRAGELSKEEFLKRIAVYKERIHGIQSVFQG